jgi:hypothetical protein
MQFRQYINETMPDFIVLAHPDHIGDYEQAVEAFAAHCSRSRLSRALLALGVSARDIRWHFTNPGKCRMCAAAE